MTRIWLPHAGLLNPMLVDLTKAVQWMSYPSVDMTFSLLGFVVSQCEHEPEQKFIFPWSRLNVQSYWCASLFKPLHWGLFTVALYKNEIGGKLVACVKSPLFHYSFCIKVGFLKFLCLYRSPERQGRKTLSDKSFSCLWLKKSLN